jgi:hypothetical protein
MSSNSTSATASHDTSGSVRSSRISSESDSSHSINSLARSYSSSKNSCARRLASPRGHTRTRTTDSRHWPLLLGARRHCFLRYVLNRSTACCAANSRSGSTFSLVRSCCSAASYFRNSTAGASHCESDTSLHCPHAVSSRSWLCNGNPHRLHFLAPISPPFWSIPPRALLCDLRLTVRRPVAPLSPKRSKPDRMAGLARITHHSPLPSRRQAGTGAHTQTVRTLCPIHPRLSSLAINPPSSSASRSLRAR